MSCFPLLLVALLISSAATAQLADDCREQATVAERFANDYIASLQSQSHTSTLRWLIAHQQASDALVAAYQTQQQAAWQADPELVPAADLLFDAQDFPDDGFVAIHCDGQSHHVTLRGKTWTDFTLNVRLVKQAQTWLVDAMGAVNVATAL